MWKGLPEGEGEREGGEEDGGGVDGDFSIVKLTGKF